MIELNELESTIASARRSAPKLAFSDGGARNLMLHRLTGLLRERSAQILEANAEDIEAARKEGLTGAFIDRLTLNPQRIEAMAASVESVAALPDPVGEVIAGWRRPNGLEIVKVRVPIGVVAVVYESRPNVTIDAAVLAIKAGNVVVLRGGRHALNSNRVLARAVWDALAAAELPEQALVFIGDPDRSVVGMLKQRPDLIDVIIPRGGHELKQALAGSEVPVLPHFDGVCNVYVDRAADLAMAERICWDAKMSRPSVCNAMENLLVHAAVAEPFLKRLGPRLQAAGAEVRGCRRTSAILPWAKPASESDWGCEYLDKILAVKVVDSLEEALEFIARYGSGLADAIVTEDLTSARRFERAVDSATVYVNASTRFTDGFEFGFGAETGISTHRLHARGPMGLAELTTYKYIVRGAGQVRG